MQTSLDDNIDDACFDGLKSLIHKLTGITIKQERQIMLVGRLRPRLRALEISSYPEYLEYVRANKSEHEEFVNKVTTNETYFFRTPRVWEYIEQSFLPEWQAAKSSSTLQVWSAASSTGEEAHTLGIFLEHFRKSNPGVDYRIHGTDIDTTVVEKATQGLYKGRSVERFRQTRPDMFKRYMAGNDDDGFRVLPDIKSRMNFTQLNLFDSPLDGAGFDLIFLRNVLIYFTKEDQEKLMSALARRIKPEGTLIIGESESLNSLNTGFEAVKPTIYKPIAEDARRAA